MNIEYDKGGWYRVESESKKNHFYHCFPREAYCTCPSLKKPCKHLEEIYARLQDKGMGINNLKLGG
jgi:hypothetical protein